MKPQKPAINIAVNKKASSRADKPTPWMPAYFVAGARINFKPMPISEMISHTLAYTSSVKANAAILRMMRV